MRSLRAYWPSVLLRLAIVATTSGLLARATRASPLPATLYEIVEWKRRGGVFVWTAVTHVGFRLALGLLGLPLLAFAGHFAAAWLEAWFTRNPAELRAWLTWGVLLLLDLGVLLLGVLMHRDLGAKQVRPSAGAATQGRPPHRRS